MIMNPTLATLLTVSVTGIAATLVLLLIFFIPVLRQVRRTAHDAEKLIDSVRPHVAPVSHDITAISRELKSIIMSIQRQVDRVEGGIETAHNMAVRVKEFRIEIQRRIVKPLFILISVLGGLKLGIGTMARIVSRRTAGKQSLLNSTNEESNLNCLTEGVKPSV
jgi:uncharacterized protein YoxC